MMVVEALFIVWFVSGFKLEVADLCSVDFLWYY